jgi:hypothetical protein
MEMKKCTKCKEEKELNVNNFYLNKNYWHPHCKLCKKKYLETYYQDNKEEIDANNKKYIETHKEEVKEYQVQYRQDHQEEAKEYNQQYYQDHKEDINQYNKIYQAKPENKEKRNTNIRIKRQEDPNIKLKTKISNSIRRGLKKNGSSKNGDSCIDYLPYTIEELKSHIENQFEPWMTWENWGAYDSKTWDDNDDSTKTWQLDHIIPHSIFKYTSMKDQSFKNCWKLSNLRPLNAKQNIVEGSTRIRH